MYVSTCMHLYRTFIPYSIAPVLVYLIFLLLCSTNIILPLIPVLYFYLRSFRWVATTLALIIPHNSNYNIRDIRSAFVTSTIVIRIHPSIHPSIHPYHVFRPQPLICVASVLPSGQPTHTDSRLVWRPQLQGVRALLAMGLHRRHHVGLNWCSLAGHSRTHYRTRNGTRLQSAARLHASSCPWSCCYCRRLGKLAHGNANALCIHQGSISLSHRNFGQHWIGQPRCA